MNFTIGTDPEFFIKDKKDQLKNLACLLKGTKMSCKI